MTGMQRQQELEHALEHFGFGEPKAAGEHVHIIAEVLRLTIKTMFVVPINPATLDRDGRSIELFREPCVTLYFTNDYALIRMPLQTAAVLRIAPVYRLNTDQVEHFMGRARAFNPLRD